MEVKWNKYNNSGNPKIKFGTIKKHFFEKCFSCESRDVEIQTIGECKVIKCNKCGDSRFL